MGDWVGVSVWWWGQNWVAVAASLPVLHGSLRSHVLMIWSHNKGWEVFGPPQEAETLSSSVWIGPECWRGHEK